MFRTLSSTFHMVLTMVAINQLVLVAAVDYTANTEAALATLQQWYNNTNGLWVPSTGWWNSANCLTMLGDLAAVDSNVQANVTAVFAKTFSLAQTYNLKMTKVVMADFNVESFYDTPVPAGMDLAIAAANTTDSTNGTNPAGFLNGFYDDEGWWALGWIQAYDVTKNQAYLDMAADIFEDMKNGSTTPCGGGIWWDKAHTYVNAIANELYLSVGAHLANRMSNKAYYTNIAVQQWNWLQGSGMINSKSLFNDGLVLKTCKNNNGTVWSYNQGVVLGALVELNTAQPNGSYLTMASTIAKAAIAQLGDSKGVLHDSCEPNCGSDGNQFKGIFMRNLQRLQTASPDNTFLEFMATNAASIWANDRNTKNNQLGVVWSGFTGTPTAATQSSAMDALVAAVTFKDSLANGIVSRTSNSQDSYRPRRSRRD